MIDDRDRGEEVAIPFLRTSQTAPEKTKPLVSHPEGIEG